MLEVARDFARLPAAMTFRFEKLCVSLTKRPRSKEFGEHASLDSNRPT